ncbi:MAG: hypothetical protein IJV47_01085 [Candidatus Methanomethylophilaceae archaeon]|nr:hypothetical protein [Candidatus Methanomethylophilaceae archaeon]
MKDTGSDIMAVLGFTTVGSLLKDQTELAKSKGIETFGVTVIDDADGKHDKVTASNAQLHLFMQLKRGNVTHLLFQSSEEAEIFFSNIEAYYGKEKADSIISGVQLMAIGDAGDYLTARNMAFISKTSFEDAILALV